MDRNYNFSMEQKDIVKVLTTTVDSFIRGQLINKEQRSQHREQCAERLAAEDGSCGKETEVRYSDQAVLANLDWGIEALEEALDTSNMETKLARLDHAEKMLQVCSMLNCEQKTAGVPNFYLSAWAHLNLAYLWKLRNNIQNSVLHVIEMFTVDPFFSRIDFAPELWKLLFLPHMSSIIGWYSEQRQRLMIEVIPDSQDMSYTADLDQFFNESLIYAMRPDQIDKLQQLEQLYGESLDENTRLYAKYFKECMTSNAASGKKVMPMMPIAEPPMTPLHEISHSIPDFVKFGPILPKSAGFSPILKSKDGTRDVNSSASAQNLEPARWEHQHYIPEENEDDSDYEPNDHNIISDHEKEEAGGKVHTSSILRSRVHSPTIFSPIISPNASPKVSTPKSDTHGSTLRLLSVRITDSAVATSLPASPGMSNDYSISSADSDVEETTKSCIKVYSRTSSMNNELVKMSKNSPPNENDEGEQSHVLLPSSKRMTTKSRPPKDFVCPITGQIFIDPVTLETGQTYERKAIQEWLKRGNTTCPMTRQPISTTVQLPSTNYVLKRLITSWKEQHPELSQEYASSYETPKNTFQRATVKEVYSGPTTPQRSKRFTQAVVATSPKSVISQAAVEAIINGVKPHIACLCTSEKLQECEAAVLEIAKIWKDLKGDHALHPFLSQPTTVNGFIEILSASMDREVLRTSVYILSELIYADESVGETCTSVDSDLDCLASLLKNGLAEPAVLIYQLRPVFAQISAHDLVPSLVQLLQSKTKESDDLELVIDPKDAALSILEQLLLGGDENSRSINALSVISANGIPILVKYLDRPEGRRSIVSILLCCMQAEKTCRNLIANRIELSHVLELFHNGSDGVRGICVEFLSELVQLNRRTLCNQILQMIKDEGAFSTMHAFLVYLQMAPMEQKPAVATLLLQLDLLVEPSKMSIYREESIEGLIESLRMTDFSNSQLMALDALLCLTGRITSSGESYTEVWLLKLAGFDQPYNSLAKAERLRKHDNDFSETMDEEEKALSSWQKRVAFVLCNHEKGSIFNALHECLKSNNIEMTRSCLVIATWLINMLSVLPDTGVKIAARKALLEEFVNVLQSSNNLEEKILATLALKYFVNEPAALEELGVYAKCIYKTMRKLKRSTPIASEIMKSLMNLSSVDVKELWSCAEVVELDSCANGEVMSMLHLKGHVISSHSDGTIKVWDAGKKAMRLVQEVREHTKAVTCLYVSPLGDKLYSGSLDKTIRVWAIKSNEIHCLQVHDVKEVVYELVANAKLACFISQGTGVRVYEWSGVQKHINFNKNVKSLAITGNTVYCGCSGYSIQEIELGRQTSSTFYSGTRKLLGKQVFYSLEIHDGILFAGGSSVDASAGKIFSLPNKAVLGSFATGYNIHCIAINNDLVFTATKCGIIEVWLKEKFTRIASIKTACNGHAKITSLVADMDGRLLFAGSSDGRIQVWALD